MIGVYFRVLSDFLLIIVLVWHFLPSVFALFYSTANEHHQDDPVPRRSTHTSSPKLGTFSPRLYFLCINLNLDGTPILSRSHSPITFSDLSPLNIVSIFWVCNDLFIVTEKSRGKERKWNGVRCYEGQCNVSSIMNRCILLIDKVRVEDKTYVWVSVRWKTKTLMNR